MKLEEAKQHYKPLSSYRMSIDVLPYSDRVWVFGNKLPLFLESLSHSRQVRPYEAWKLLLSSTPHNRHEARLDKWRETLHLFVVNAPTDAAFHAILILRGTSEDINVM